MFVYTKKAKGNDVNFVSNELYKRKITARAY